MNAELAPEALQPGQGLDELEQALGSKDTPDVREPERLGLVVRARSVRETRGVDGIGDQMNVDARVKGPVRGQLGAREHRDDVARHEKAPQDPSEQGVPAEKILRHRTSVNLVDDA